MTRVLVSQQFFIFRPYFIYGKGKELNQTGFFLQNLPRIYLFNFEGVTHRIQLT